MHISLKVFKRNSAAAVLNRSVLTFTFTTRTHNDCRIVLSSYMDAICCSSPEWGLAYVGVGFHSCDSKSDNILFLWVSRGKCCLMAGVLCPCTWCGQIWQLQILCFRDVELWMKEERSLRESKGNKDNRTGQLQFEYRKKVKILLAFLLSLQS